MFRKSISSRGQTFTTAYNKVFSGTSEVAANYIGPLLLTFILPDHVCGLNIQKLNLVSTCANQHMPAVRGNCHACKLDRKGDAVFFSMSPDIEDTEFLIGGDRNESLAIRGNGTILDSNARLPSV